MSQTSSSDHPRLDPIGVAEPQDERLLTRRTVVGAAIGSGAIAALPGFALAQDSTPDASHDHATPAATPLAAEPPTPFNGITGEPLRESPVFASENGLLEITLRAALGEATVAGRTVVTQTYDGEYPGPTWRARAGDTIRLQLINDLDEVTNIHTHGFHVSPKDNSDNIFLVIEPGETFEYEYVLPDDHVPGTFWYHPHAHGTTATQVNSGMAGIIIIEGNLDEVEGIAGLTEHTLALTVTQFDGSDTLVPYNSQSPDGVQRFVNGQLQPRISIRPGETQRWRIANISADNFFNIALQGHRLYEIANDGNPHDRVVPRDSIVLGPAERTEVLVQALTSPGKYDFRSLQWGVSFQAEPDTLLATMVIEGDPVDPAPLPTTLVPFEDLRGLPVDNVRVTTFETAPEPYFLVIDGKSFDHNRVDQVVKLGSLEEWVVRNTTDHWHPFHIHVNDFQVLSVNGEEVHSYGHQDTVGLPPFSETTIRMRFNDFDGKFVYHCHILRHEELGMMAVVEVVP